MTFYRLSHSKLWGDYGCILIHGMSRHLPRKDNMIQLERTGPFIPPISLPGLGDVVVTSEFRQELEESPFTDLSFAPVIKARIVEYHWERWDRNREEPAEYPEGGEPEDLILKRPHSPEIADELGALWEVIPPEDAVVESIRLGRGAWEYRVDQSTWQGSPFFRGRGKQRLIVTGEVKDWLELRVGEWLHFQEAQTS